MLPSDPGAEAGRFPERIRDAARALHSCFDKVLTYGPEGHGYSVPQAARLIPQIDEAKVSDADIFALTAICETREAGEKMAGLIVDYVALNDTARALWDHRRAAVTARLSLADRLLDRAHDNARIAAESGRADAFERDPARITGQKQRKGAKIGGYVWKERAAEWHPHAERLAVEKWKANRARSASAIAPDIVPLIPECKNGWRPRESAVRQFITPILPLSELYF